MLRKTIGLCVFFLMLMLHITTIVLTFIFFSHIHFVPLDLVRFIVLAAILIVTAAHLAKRLRSRGT